MIKEKELEDRIMEFLKHSNYIEREYRRIGLEDAKKAWDYAVENKDNISVDYILGIHKKLMKRIYPSIAGKVRNCAIHIGGEIKPYVPKKEIVKRIEYWLEYCDSSVNYDIIKKQHVEFEKLHPFKDGNGRVGRILMNIQCLNAGVPIIVIHEGREQQEYYKWFR